eukprot:SAG31_NODE_35445_length_323_cov_0.687500_1_plen_37_part_10
MSFVLWVESWRFENIEYLDTTRCGKLYSVHTKLSVGY